jgi:4-amino-4-deoxychorismate lyase
MAFIETIKVQNGVLCNLKYHIIRSVSTRSFFYGIESVIPFEDIFLSILKERVLEMDEIYKFRVVYSTDVISASIERYVIKHTLTLKVIEYDEIDYSYKYEDRSALEALREKREDCDDILIVKNGFVTDSSFGNIVYEDRGILYTPMSCLLQGTMRAKFLDEKRIIQKDLKIADLYEYKSIFMINSMAGIIPVKVMW